MRDIADYSGSWGFGSFSNATQHITETDIIKANVFKVGRDEDEEIRRVKEINGDRWR